MASKEKSGPEKDPVFFWKPDRENGFLGNWFMSDFLGEVAIGKDDIKFNCVEQ